MFASTSIVSTGRELSLLCFNLWDSSDARNKNYVKVSQPGREDHFLNLSHDRSALLVAELFEAIHTNSFHDARFHDY